MEASFHVARTAAELILRRDKAAVRGGGGGVAREKERCIWNPVPDENFENRYPIPDSCPVDNQFLLLYGL